MSTILSREERPPVKLSGIDINEADQEYILYVAAPGMTRDNISVSVEKGFITIVAGDKTEGRPDRIKNYLSNWKTTVELPSNADPLLMAASCLNGELEIHIPKGSGRDERKVLVHVY
jgi:HSP20 family molecular chaperone IbpA